MSNVIYVLFFEKSNWNESETNNFDKTALTLSINAGKQKTVVLQIFDQDQMRASSLLKTCLFALGNPGFHIQKDSSL